MNSFGCSVPAQSTQQHQATSVGLLRGFAEYSGATLAMWNWSRICRLRSPGKQLSALARRLWRRVKRSIRRNPAKNENRTSGVEVDQVFASLEDWSRWAESNPSAYRAADAAIIANRILRAGFTEPLTGRIVTPDAVSAPDTNWREGLAANGLNARQRAVLDLIAEETAGQDPQRVRIFATEAVTPFALLLRGMFPRFLGSEYGYDDAAREALYPISHQDLLALDLPAGRFDIVTTNEVLEHVPELDAALREIARVLRPGGLHIGTHPFRFTRETGDVRAKLVDGQVVHLKEPEYHGNPVDPDGGSLVFETPGWDILHRARAAGFSGAWMRFVASESKGYITENTGIFVFYARR